MRTIFVEILKQNQSLVNYISNIFPNLYYSTLQKALRNKDIKVNGKRINLDCNIQSGDKIDIYITDNLLFNLPEKLEYVYEDDNIIAIYKPQGILSNNEEKVSNNEIRRIGGFEPTLEDRVKQIYSDAAICHRLDRNTAGIVIFSKNENAYKELLRAFKNSLITKKYIAYVSNTKFDKTHEILTNYILKDAKNGFSKMYNTQVENSQKAVTEYNVKTINKKGNYAVLEVIIHTGKTHQIRTQLQAIGHPIIGDSKYGKNDINKKYKVFKQLLFAIDYTFNFEKSSSLYYLNDIAIKLDNKYYDVVVGSDKNEENTKA